MNPQSAFIEMLVAAMKDAALEKKLTQLALQFDPTETGKGPLKRVRVVVIPEEMDHTWPSHAPLGSMGNG
jgi:hypothetical protein